MNARLILGPPGTGKTTRLLSIVEDAIARGVPPERIAYLAFTRAAANEARDRAVSRFGLDVDRFPMFRTLHSLAYRQLRLSRDEVMTSSDWATLGQELGLELLVDDRDADHPWDVVPGSRSLGAQLLRHYQRARALCVPMERVPSDVPEWYVTRFQKALCDFKRRLGLLDFADMLDEWHPQIDADILIVDEAQDLTRQQWRHVFAMKEQVEEVWAAGDDDQSIYQWAGADLDTLLALDWPREVLPRSYRLPPKVKDVADRVISKARRRFPKSWAPAEHEGRVEWSLTSHTELDADDWLLLSRTRAGCERLAAHARSAGRPYMLHGVSSLSTPAVRSVIAWTRLSRGHEVSLADARALLRFRKARISPSGPTVGPSDVVLEEGSFDVPWYEALSLPPQERSAIRALLRSGHSLTAPPNVRVMTIHQAKGLEASNVLLDGRPTGRDDTGEEEVRVWYVATTRAKKRLVVERPDTNPWLN
jgi:DNA helicase-2/ATP-dependent DNA helicase PcrA